jgi:hypothetical protein
VKRLTILVALVVAVVISAPAVSAADTTPTSPTAPSGANPQAPGLPPPPAGVVFAPSHPAQLIAGLSRDEQQAQAALQSDQQRNQQAQAALATAQSTEATAAATLAELKGREYQAALNLVAARDRLRNLAVDDFVAGGDGAIELGLILQSGNFDELGRRQELMGVVSENMRRAIDAYRSAEQQAAGAAGPAATAVSQSEDALGKAESAVALSQSQLVSDQSKLQSTQATLAAAQIAAPAAGTDIPQIVLQAYQHAADMSAFLHPSCHLSWQDLAALGRIESDNAQHANTRIAANGDTYPPILGPPLDGSGGNAALPLPPLSYYDGPGPWEEAVGPMQFLPTSWTSVAMVGGSDPTPDPNNVFDAAISAANYLCRAVGPAGRLDTTSGLETAYYSYNHSDSYVAEALSNATYYGATLITSPSGA